MLASAIALSLTALPSEAQSHLVKLTNHLEPYGFFRASAIFDARNSKADTEDLFYYVPYDKKINLEGNDIWYNPSIKMSAITTRLGVNLTGFRYGSFNVTGKLETDFYLLTGGSASLSLREAYLKFNWDNLGDFFKSVSVKAGHAWHPMSLDMPYSVGYEAGAPFNPYARSPQLMFETNLMDRFTFTAGLLYPMEFMVGDHKDHQLTMSSMALSGIVRWPDIFIKVHQGQGRSGFKSLVPRWRTTDLTYYHDVGTKVKDRISMISPMACFEFSKGMFKVNAKAVLASGGDHLRLMGGYAVYDKSDAYKYKYTPLRSVTGFASASYGQQWQFILFAGGMTALGAGHDLITDDETGYAKTAYIYYFDGGFKNIRSCFVSLRRSRSISKDLHAPLNIIAQA